MNILKWDIYEIKSVNNLQGVMFRGRLRKFALENNINLLIENDETLTTCVRFALISEEQEQENFDKIAECIKKIDSDSETVKVMENVPNPVLSKLKVNDESRYTL
ncbi:MAG: hypothetical protein WCG20_03405 [bacterium]